MMSINQSGRWACRLLMEGENEAKGRMKRINASLNASMHERNISIMRKSQCLTIERLLRLKSMYCEKNRKRWILRLAMSANFERVGYVAKRPFPFELPALQEKSRARQNARDGLRQRYDEQRNQ